jgi:O-6-methylguanine DNA methyltransferase
MKMKEKRTHSEKTFCEKVYEITAKIPEGNVTTYGTLAEIVGNTGAARAVGACMKNNHDTTRIPCHRVVAANGALTGYAFGGVLAKKKKLEAEGVLFRREKVDLEKSGWKK